MSQTSVEMPRSVQLSLQVCQHIVKIFSPFSIFHGVRKLASFGTSRANDSSIDNITSVGEEEMSHDELLQCHQEIGRVAALTE